MIFLSSHLYSKELDYEFVLRRVTVRVFGRLPQVTRIILGDSL